jgi:zinc protease
MNLQTPASLKKTSLPGPHDITRTQLANGITVLVRPNPNTLSVSIAGYLPAGGLYDPPEKLGLSDFTSSCLTRGTEQFTFPELYDRLESLGAGLNFSGGTHTAGFNGKSLAVDLDLLFEVLASALRHPVFPPEHIERVRAQHLTSLSLRAQDTGEMASLLFDQIVYEGHPYSNPEEGHPETIVNIQREDLVDFHRRYYGPEGLVIAVVGGTTPEAVLAQVENTLGDWTNPHSEDEITVAPVAPLEQTVRKHTAIPEKSQTDILIGTAGPSRSAPDYTAAKMGNSVLGQFGMMGRIGESVRNKAGLAYYAYSAVSSSIGPGPWYVSAGVHPQNVEQAIELITAELERFVGEPVSEEELEDSKSSYIGKLPLALESNAGVSGALLNLERYDLGLDYYQRYEEIIREVTPEDALKAARSYLDLERLAIATAGIEL